MSIFWLIYFSTIGLWVVTYLLILYNDHKYNHRIMLSDLLIAAIAALLPVINVILLGWLLTELFKDAIIHLRRK